MWNSLQTSWKSPTANPGKTAHAMLTRPGKYSLSNLAKQFELELHGDDDTVIDGIGTLSKATASQLSFLANPGYRSELPQTRAGVVILRPQDAEDCPTNYFLAADPYLAYARLSSLFQPSLSAAPGVHPSAVIDETAQLGKDVFIGPLAVIGPGCEIGAGSYIGSGTVIEADSKIGVACQLHANVSVGRNVVMGDRVIIHPGVVLGADGFGIAFAQDHWEKVPQLGGLKIGNDCEIGANTTIDRGAIDDTVLEEGVRIDNLVQIAHNVHIGAHTAIAAQTGIAGSAKIGRYCLLAGRSGVTGHAEIADRVTIGATSVAFESIEEPGTTWSSMLPARPLKKWLRIRSNINKLDEIAKRLKKTENL
jgi:UDP-3-O-[3-hydroxymyristoyl] glucosamine N-acyltransferase